MADYCEDETGSDLLNHLAIKILISTFIGIAWYNALELLILIFVTFSQYRGLYFWSLILSAAVGVIPYSLGFLLKLFKLTPILPISITLLTFGWYFMVTGQSIVLYSRLHLVLRNPTTLRRVLWMIIFNAVVLHIPTSVLTIGANFVCNTDAFHDGYNVMEKLQMTGFCIQEFIISGIYIWETIKLLRMAPEKGKRKIMYQLLGINLIIIILDLALLSVEYADLYVIETTLKAAVYSIKLKLEFAVLGKLVHIVNNHNLQVDISSKSHEGDYPDFVDATRVTSDVTHARPNLEKSQSPRPPPWMHPDEYDIAMFEHSEHRHSSRGNRTESTRSSSGWTPTEPAVPLKELSLTDFTSSSSHPTTTHESDYPTLPT
ncbi:hypothetical protein FQN54_008397 [Arachnomyces sp. PD_36]|nr:hypothetical protein FQN54_008397 [Arachnomyces sp. PD_36]